MAESVFNKFNNGCLMVFRREGETVQFLGTTFLVHDSGYLLTVSHILPSDGDLVVVPGESMSNEFTPVSQETVTSIPVTVARRNNDRDIALLKMTQPVDMRLPDYFLGTAENVHIGSRVTALGYAFGHQALHALVAMNAIVSARVLSHNDSKLLLFDSMVHDGDRGGPLVSVEEGVVVGIINGRFDPLEAAKEYTDGSRTVASNTNISYAVAIDYGIALMDEEGLLTATTPM